MYEEGRKEGKLSSSSWGSGAVILPSLPNREGFPHPTPSPSLLRSERGGEGRRRRGRQDRRSWDCTNGYRRMPEARQLTRGHPRPLGRPPPTLTSAVPWRDVQSSRCLLWLS